MAGDSALDRIAEAIQDVADEEGVKIEALRVGWTTPGLAGRAANKVLRLSIETTKEYPHGTDRS